MVKNKQGCTYINGVYSATQTNCGSIVLTFGNIHILNAYSDPVTTQHSTCTLFFMLNGQIHIFPAIPLPKVRREIRSPRSRREFMLRGWVWHKEEERESFGIAIAEQETLIFFFSISLISLCKQNWCCEGFWVWLFWLSWFAGTWASQGLNKWQQNVENLFGEVLNELKEDN